MDTMRNAVFSFIAIFLVAFVTSCTSNPKEVTTEPTQLIKYDSIGYYGKDRAQAVIDSVLDVFLTGRTMKPDAFRSRFTPAQHGISFFKVAYNSTIPEMDNKPVVAYGLIAIPDSILPGAPIVSYQHGTIFDRTWCPSNPDGSIELQFQLSQFASQGYIVIAADYFGTTEGTEVPNSYGMTSSAAQACLDMLKASKEVLQQRNITPGKLFLNGWSQGGASTNYFLQRLEKEEIPVAAAVTASGPADQVIFLQQTITNPTPFVAPYFPAVIGNILFSFDAYTDLKGLPEQMIRPEFLEACRKLHSFDLPFEEYAKQVLVDKENKWRTFSDIFTPQFIEDTKTATSPFWKALAEMNGYRWKMTTPYRCFFSNRDEAVVAKAANIIVDHQKSLGNNAAEAFDAGPEADHGCVYLEAIINAKPWFDSMR